jgi:endonuclease/exonuclease/phosphatase family metal-dependent hydrolase
MAFLIVLWVTETFIGERFWLSTGLLYFPQHWIGVPGALLLTWALLRRDATSTVVSLAGLCFFAFFLLGLNIPLRVAPAGAGQPLRVMTYNIHYGSGGIVNLVDVIKAQSPDVICIQESRALGRWPDPVPQMKRLLPGWSMARGGDVATFSRHPIVMQRLHPMPQPVGRVVLETVILVNGEQVAVFNTHISTAGNIRQGNRARPGRWWTMPGYVQSTARTRALQLPVLLRAAEAATLPTIICGDFNNPPRGSFYRRLTRNFRSAFSAAGWGTGFTFRSDLPVLRIDHILTGLGIHVTSCHVPRVSASDHRPVVAELSLPTT